MHQGAPGRIHKLIQSLFEGANLRHLQIVRKTLRARKDDEDLAHHVQRLVLALFQDFGQPFATRQLSERGLVEVGTELCESRQLAVLRQLEAQGPRHLAHRLDLRIASHPAHGISYVDRVTDAGMKQVRLEKDLAVGDGDHVCRNVGRNIAGLRFDDGQRCKGAAAVLGAQLRAALQQSGMQVEDISGKGLPPRGTPQKQRNLSVSRRMLRQIIINHERMLTMVPEILTHGATAVGGDVLHGGGIGGRGRDYDRAVQSVVIRQRLHHLRNRGALLSDRNVNGNNVRVNDDCRLSRLTVSNDQLPLPSTDGNHGVNGLETRLQ